jgi:hypothetical protein
MNPNRPLQVQEQSQRRPPKKAGGRYKFKTWRQLQKRQSRNAGYPQQDKKLLRSSFFRELCGGRSGYH